MTFDVPPPPMNDHEIQVAQLSALVRRHRELAAESAGLQEQMKEVKDRISQMTAPGWKLVVDGISATHREPNRCFSLKLALDALPVEIAEQCVDKTPRFDPARIREEVEKAGLLEACMEIDPARTAGVLRLA